VSLGNGFCHDRGVYQQIVRQITFDVHRIWRKAVYVQNGMDREIMANRFRYMVGDLRGKSEGTCLGYTLRLQSKLRRGEPSF